MRGEEPKNFFPFDKEHVIREVGPQRLVDLLRTMIRIRNFEIRAETAYQQGDVGGFLHLYIGQEAIQTAAVHVLGQQQWYSCSYRCHALALLLGETPASLMSELYGKEDGNARGRGGSMHFYSSRMLGGFGIVAGQIPVATGAAFSCKYLGKKEEISVCFFGDGALAQGVFHESLNLASLWSLPCLYVIENNKWSMGTPLDRTIVNHQHFSEAAAKAYGIRHFLLDGMDILHCLAGFTAAYQYMIQEQRPVLIECLAERFRGHSISDPGLYRTKDELKASMERDPITLLSHELKQKNLITDDQVRAMEKECREEMLKAISHANAASWPDISDLERDVFAPQKE